MEITPESDYSCSICIDVIDEETITLKRCGHTFHKFCIQQWYQKSNTCPLCRRIIKDIFKIRMKLNNRKIFNYKCNFAVELLENKLQFRYIKKNNIIINNITFVKKNIPINNNYENIEEIENNLQQINYISDFKKNENLGKLYCTILYQDIFKVSFYNKTVCFFNLHQEKNKIQAQRNNNKVIKIEFQNKVETINFFETLKKRHEFFRMYNY
jgi:hypothetical protein